MALSCENPVTSASRAPIADFLCRLCTRQLRLTAPPPPKQATPASVSGPKGLVHNCITPLKLARRSPAPARRTGSRHAPTAASTSHQALRARGSPPYLANTYSPSRSPSSPDNHRLRGPQVWIRSSRLKMHSRSSRNSDSMAVTTNPTPTPRKMVSAISEGVGPSKSSWALTQFFSQAD